MQLYYHFISAVLYASLPAQLLGSCSHAAYMLQRRLLNSAGNDRELSSQRLREADGGKERKHLAQPRC